MSALDVQVSGSHYKDLAIQPVEYIHANNIPYMEGNVIKYVSRWRAKNGIKDLEKAKHYIELLIELETRNGSNS
jgi:UDP-3-O-acyl-N-acetylglucosamine deacetylase